MLILQDVLDMLVGRTVTPSSLGPQLERLRDGVSVEPDPYRAREIQHWKLLHDAELYRCLDRLCDQERCTFSKLTPTIEKLAKRLRRPAGAIAVGIMRAYQERATSSQERGLVEVYNYLRRLDPTHFPPLLHDEHDAVQAFRVGKAKAARRRALELQADAYLILQKWVDVWNSRK